ncbi:Sodium channel protein type 11 subunit alpha (NaN) (Sensory neuron sodium channel 2) (Sodium channel protein type XI subunit alpha) (Voltage-gated sodium channel subunit alpha Nav1.9) [Durusdinium trenchii]|uniref:Sodium channel protein type 11 subunit alpha (NaN) (Sensory neuron sodium channel 2) (Sodium channel protein type XI subunit alpha) (Voltage-gated sodium channel subunit alpha Nav1.9) n=1 Tax=Durusdinium trenchii TaxID=1381693 RepID=A0ABP0LYJ5_9DINO
MGRPGSPTENFHGFEENDLSNLPALVEKVLEDQHEELLRHLDKRLERHFAQLMNGWSPPPPRQTFFSQASKLSRSTSRVTGSSLPALKRLQSELPNPPSMPRQMSPASPMFRQMSPASLMPHGMSPTSPMSRGALFGYELTDEPQMPKVVANLSDNSASSNLVLPVSLDEEKHEDPVSATGTSGRNTVQSAASEVKHSEEGLNSYDLAHRQGSKVDFFKKQMMMSSSDVVGGSDEFQANGVWSRCQQRVAYVVKSNLCELFFALMIVTNSVYLGVQLQMSATDPIHAKEAEQTFTAVNLFYAVVFLLEVLLRLVASGVKRYFLYPGWGWNWLDVFVVTSTWVELAVSIFEVEGANGISNSNLRLLRVVKVSRLARVLRVLRIVQYVRPLRTLMHCLVDTTKSFVWAMLLLILMMYVFGLLFTDACLDYLREADVNLEDPEVKQFRRFFGTVTASVTTLFRAISNGLDWGDAANLLQMYLDEFWVQLFHLYISFISFAVLNVMTGVFCHSAIKAAERDHEMVIHGLLQNKKEFKELVSNLFYRIDDLGLGMITISEFERHFDDDAVRAFFESLEMGAADAWTLFAALDADGDNVISLKDFTERCIQLHGPARSVDLYALTQQNAKLREQLKYIEEMQHYLARVTLMRPTGAQQAKPGGHALPSLIFYS